jgi:hypothetical protein
MPSPRPVTRVVRPRSGGELLPQTNSLQALPPEPPALFTFDFSKRPRSRDQPASTGTRSKAHNAAAGAHDDAAEGALQQRLQREKQVMVHLISSGFPLPILFAKQ